MDLTQFMATLVGKWCLASGFREIILLSDEPQWWQQARDTCIEWCFQSDYLIHNKVGQHYASNCFFKLSWKYCIPFSVCRTCPLVQSMTLLLHNSNGTASWLQSQIKAWSLSRIFGPEPFLRQSWRKTHKWSLPQQLCVKKCLRLSDFPRTHSFSCLKDHTIPLPKSPSQGRATVANEVSKNPWKRLAISSGPRKICPQCPEWRRAPVLSWKAAVGALLVY
jgi:hypothetical protein